MAWNTPSPPTRPGEWESYSAGNDYRGYVLKCGKLFHAHITSNGGRYYTTFNGGTLPIANNIGAAKVAVEREMVKWVRQMLPAYRTIHDRLRKNEATQSGNVTSIHPMD